MKKNELLIALSAALTGSGIGWVSHQLYAYNHTPESTLAELSVANAEKKRLIEEAKETKAEAEKVLRALESTKKEYQDEIRPEIEAKIRKEFGDRIDKADAVYEKAKRENDMASLKLELAKQYKKTAAQNFNGIRIDFDNL